MRYEIPNIREPQRPSPLPPDIAQENADPGQLALAAAIMRPYDATSTADRRSDKIYTIYDKVLFGDQAYKFVTLELNGNQL